MKVQINQQRRMLGLSAFAFGVTMLPGCGGGESPAAPSVLTQPKDISVGIGQSVEFSVTASGDPITFQWFRDGKAISGANQRTYTLASVTTADNGAAFTVELSNSKGSALSSAAKLTVKFVASTDQVLFDSYYLEPSQAFSISWSLPLSGTPTTGLHFVAATSNSYALSPHNGQQSISLGVPIALSKAQYAGKTSARRYLVNGEVVIGGGSRAVFANGGIRVDSLAADGKTVVASQTRSNLINTPLTGTIAESPVSLRRILGTLFFNPKVLTSAATWAAGAAYLEYTATNAIDRLLVVDWTASTTGTEVSPVAQGTTLLAQLDAGIVSSNDGITYSTSNGSISTVQGVQMYIASDVRPRQTTPTYQCFFELNGNVYAATLVKAGAVFGGSVLPVDQGSGVITADYSVNRAELLNASAVSSLKLALAF